MSDGFEELALAKLTSLEEGLDRLEQRFDALEKRLAVSMELSIYTTEQAADKLEMAAWTVRRWCSLGRVPGARKKPDGSWVIPAESLERLQAEGPVPLPRLRMAS